MSTVILRWAGDLDQDKREQAGCVSSSSDQYRPKKIELRPEQKEIRIGRINSKSPPDYPIESCINSRMISRNHATIERSGKGSPMLYDHSMNGTYVNYTRVMGGVLLKEGDVVCFGHLNGANLKPGENVATFYSDLKYRVHISEPVHVKREEAIISSAHKKKGRPSIAGSVVSSTQQSAEDSSSSLDTDSKLRLSKDRKNKRPHKSRKEEDSKRPSKAVKSSKQRKTGPLSIAKREANANSSDSEREPVYADQEDCSAKPCKNPQDANLFWIQCDSCEKWYHQQCLGISIPENSNDDYHCPYCEKKA